MTRTVTLEVGDCYRCGAETTITIPLLRRNIERYGDRTIETVWCCPHHMAKHAYTSSGVYEQTDAP